MMLPFEKVPIAQTMLATISRRTQSTLGMILKVPLLFIPAVMSPGPSCFRNVFVFHPAILPVSKTSSITVLKHRLLLNDGRAMARLSIIYTWGADGVPKDLTEALAWMYVQEGFGGPGIDGNDNFKLAITILEGKTGKDGVILARKKSDELTAEIKGNPFALHTP